MEPSAKTISFPLDSYASMNSAPYFLTNPAASTLGHAPVA